MSPLDSVAWHFLVNNELMQVKGRMRSKSKQQNNETYNISKCVRYSNCKDGEIERRRSNS